jgi:hypothetical protein
VTGITERVFCDCASHACVIGVTAWISINHVQVVQTETHVLTPENCPAPLQDPKAAASAASRALFKTPVTIAKDSKGISNVN